MNRMKEIATMFDLEWLEDENRSEIFIVLIGDSKILYDDCYIGIEGLLRVSEAYMHHYTLSRLLIGNIIIRKHLRKGDSYYLIDPYKEKGYKKYTWNGDFYDKHWLRNGRLYRTEKEAQEAIQKLGWDINTENVVKIK